MTEVITTMRIEDAVGAANGFLNHEQATTLDGAQAAGSVALQIESVRGRADRLLHAHPRPASPDSFVPLSRSNAHDFAEARAVLPGYVVLVPAAMTGTKTQDIYPAVVSGDGPLEQLRLHVLQQPYNARRGLSDGGAVVLSAAGQSESGSVGQHRSSGPQGVEAEHFATLLTAGVNENVRTRWQQGEHINHAWRSSRTNAVTTEVYRQLFGSDIPQTTLSLTEADFAHNRAMLLWHMTLAETEDGRPEAATRPNALVIVQALGFQAMTEQNPKSTDTLKRMIA